MLLDKERGKAAPKSPSSVPRAFSKDSLTITPDSLSPPSVKSVFPSNHLAFLPSILLADSSVLSIVFSSPHPSLSLRSGSGNSTGFWSQNDSNPYHLWCLLVVWPSATFRTSQAAFPLVLLMPALNGDFNNELFLRLQWRCDSHLEIGENADSQDPHP